MNLLNNNYKWIHTFEEAAIIKTGAALWSLFTVALTHGSVTDPKQLWLQFRDAICDDLAHRLSNYSC
jgi:hypothetical protein